MRAISGTGKAMRFVFGLQFAVLAAIVVMATWGVNRLIDEAAWVTHTHQVLAAAAETMVEHGHVKVDTRSYLLLGDRRFLEQIDRSTERLWLGIDKIQVLTKDNPPQQENVRKYRDAIAAHIRLSTSSTDLEERGSREAALRPFRDGRMEELSRQVEADFLVIQGEEQRLLGVRNERLSYVINRIYMFAPLMTILEFLSVIVAYVVSERATYGAKL